MFLSRAPLIAALIIPAVCTASNAQYYGLFIGTNQIGYSKETESSVTLNGRRANLITSDEQISAELLGTSLQMSSQTQSWETPSGRILVIKAISQSAGRVQTVSGISTGNGLQTTVIAEGHTTTRLIPFPNGPIVDDPLSVRMSPSVHARTVYTFDPETVAFIKMLVTVKGASKINIAGIVKKVHEVDVSSTQLTFQIFVDEAGQMVKTLGPMNIEILPESEHDALHPAKSAEGTIDLATASRIPVHGPVNLTDPANLTELSVKLVVDQELHLPSDRTQRVSTVDGGYKIVEIPKAIAATSIAIAASEARKWVQPSLFIPSNDPKIRRLAKEITLGHRTVRTAARAVQLYVCKIMTPNAGIGVLRDAREILKSKQGVCRDYAILTATLLRAAGIPTRVVGGIVDWDDAYYYHAWVEVFDGSGWAGVDSTTTNSLFSASHIKLAEGNVDSAFAFPVLENAQIDVESAKGK